MTGKLLYWGRESNNYKVNETDKPRRDSIPVSFNSICIFLGEYLHLRDGTVFTNIFTAIPEVLLYVWVLIESIKQKQKH